MEIVDAWMAPFGCAKKDSLDRPEIYVLGSVLVPR
jgi:hypothetical protein